MNDLDLDAIEARLARWDEGDCLSVVEYDLYNALIAEVRRLRAMLEVAADEFDDYIKDNRNIGPGTTKLLNHWAEEVASK